MTHPVVLLTALLLASPALIAVAEGALAPDQALLRLIASLVLCSAVAAVLRRALPTPSAPPPSARQPADRGGSSPRPPSAPPRRRRDDATAP